MRILSLVLCFVLMSLSGCTVGPNYKRPSVQTPQTWRFEAGTVQAIDPAWWRRMGDPALDRLIETALKENKNVLAAAARIDEYMGHYGIAMSEGYPQARLQAEGGRQRMTETGYSPVPPSISPTFYNVQGIFQASWELDLWGRIRRATEAARADLLGQEENRQAVALSLAASVANGYINLLSLDRQLDIAHRTAQTRKESLRLFELRFAGGVISEVELSQVQSEYEHTRSIIPQTEKLIIQQENDLSLLLGRNPGRVSRGGPIDKLTLPPVPVGLPSSLLERRPDIRQAEQNLIAANARIGVAKAAYFPSISLTGAFGAASAELRDLFTGPSRVWNWGGAIGAPLFTAGKIRGQVKAAQALQKQALLQYEQTLQRAFREVEDALADYRKAGEKLDALERQVGSLKNYRDLSQLRYENGYSSYLEVLDAERNLFSAELAFTETRSGQFQALVNLYKAMGGGWSSFLD